MSDDWFSYRDIRFAREQFFFLINNLEIIKEGYWPPSPDKSSATEIPGEAVPKSYAYYTKPCEIAGEVEFRLNKTGDDGKTLVHEIQELGVDTYEKLAPDAKNALNYISGWRRRKTSYKDFLATRNYYQKLTKFRT